MRDLLSCIRFHISSISSHNPICLTCGSQEEDALHLLHRCPFSRACFLSGPLGLRSDELQGSLVQVLMLVASRLDDEQWLLYVNSVWALWRCRNDCAYASKQPDFQQFTKYLNSVNWESRTGASRRFCTLTGRARHEVSLSEFRTDYNCYLDGSWSESWHGGVGIVLWHKEELIVYKSKVAQGCCSLQVEAIALKEAIMLVLGLGIATCSFFCDCLELVNICSNQAPPIAQVKLCVQIHAGYQTYNGEYYGGEARISVWGVPHMNPHSSYEVSITLFHVNGDRISLIKAGLHVYPELYNNNDLRFFTSCNDDVTRKGVCYNKNCPCFVVANSSVLYPGQAVAPLSQYNGEDRYVRLSIRKDPVTKIWTLYREDFGTSSILGWWNKGLDDLDNKATNVQWVSFVTYSDNNTGPSMGSGHFPEEGKHKAAYMMDLKHFDEAGGYDSPKIVDLIPHVDMDFCYRAVPAIALHGETDKHKFYYGGPRGCRN